MTADKTLIYLKKLICFCPTLICIADTLNPLKIYMFSSYFIMYSRYSSLGSGTRYQILSHVFAR